MDEYNNYILEDYDIIIKNAHFRNGQLIIPAGSRVYIVGCTFEHTSAPIISEPAANSFFFTNSIEEIVP